MSDDDPTLPSDPEERRRVEAFLRLLDRMDGEVSGPGWVLGGDGTVINLFPDEPPLYTVENAEFHQQLEAAQREATRQAAQEKEMRQAAQEKGTPPASVSEKTRRRERWQSDPHAPSDSNAPPFTKSTYAGALLGVAVGDAFGTGVNYNAPNTITEMTGGGPFHLQPGEWTDDTALTLCTADSLFEADGFDPINHLDYMLHWLDTGYNSCKPYAFDIGGSIRRSLKAYRETRVPSPYPTGSGNGSLMRVAPIALWYALDPALASDTAGRMSQTTHGVVEATDACRYWTGLLCGAILDVDKETLLQPHYHPDPDYYRRSPLTAKIAAIAGGKLALSVRPPDIVTNGYVVSSLHTALAAFAATNTFEKGLLMAVRRGGDTDSIGAIYGTLAGAYYGFETIPVRWRRIIARRDHILSLAVRLHDRAFPHPSRLQTDAP